MNIAYIVVEHGKVTCTEFDLIGFYWLTITLGFIAGYLIRHLHGKIK